PEARVIHVDIDPSSIGKNRRAEIGIVGDARSVARQMAEAGPAAAAVTSGARLSGGGGAIKELEGYSPPTYKNLDRVVNPQYLIEELCRLTRGDAILSTEVGQHQMWLAQYYPMNGPRQMVTSGGLGTMGFGFPAALGAQLAFPDRQVVAFVGDGGFQMTAQE